MTKLQRLFSFLHKKITAAQITFVIGVLVALMVNYLSGSDSPNAVLIVLFGISSSITAGFIWFMRQRTDNLYDKILENGTTPYREAWEKASGPRKPGRATWFFVWLTVSVTTLIFFLFLLIYDNFVLPSKRDQTERLILDRVESIQQTTRLDSMTGIRVQEILLADSSIMLRLSEKIDSITLFCCKKVDVGAQKKHRQGASSIK